MPNINKKAIKEKRIRYKSESKIDSAEKYNSIAWKRLRDTYLSLHPLCECCLEHNRITPATEIHHEIPWSRGANEEEKWALFLDENNLMSLCSKCHTALHNKDREYGMGRLNDLSDTEYNYIHGLNYK